MRILLVEDDENLSRNLKFFLEREGYQVDACAGGEDALYFWREGEPDLVLLDRMLPSLDGMDLLRARREDGDHTPVLMLTALGTLSDRVSGLDFGADDYLVKPFAMEELLARIRSLCRRSLPAGSASDGSRALKLRFGDLILTPPLHELEGPGETVTLSGRECALMEYFMRNGGQTLSRASLLLKVWGAEGEVEDGNLDNYIFFLRRRLKSLRSTVVITTLRGVGYRLEGGGENAF